MYTTKSIKIALLILSIVIIYVLGFAFVEHKAEEQQFKTFEVVTGLSGLVLSVIGSIYVYNAYKAQEEQINIQKKQIIEQQIDIEENKKEAQFDRALDIIYSQLDYNKEKMASEENSLLHINVRFKAKKTNDIIGDLDKIWSVLNLFHSEITFYSKIINNKRFTTDDKELLVDIIKKNIHLYYFALVENIQIYHRQTYDKEDFIKEFQNFYINNIWINSPYLAQKHEYKNLREKEIKLDLLNRNKQNIETAHHKYKSIIDLSKKLKDRIDTFCK
ncbi:hypothetical protein [Sphingobacterium tabacisoli]|uniref:DUF4760 domain-containing protein n=1 Tax=Sphingobacterium tabacisoli TaxID=2044855 RepID=A0ABW5L7S1_9SPHI|nr:hypothetical protein [Sphingobacterium tabacisoli]